MNIESLPDFTAPARERWESIPDNLRQLLLNNVWCVTCRRGVKITNFVGSTLDRGLLLRGKCAVCHGDVARVIEAD
jgi:hypothetical protein